MTFKQIFINRHAELRAGWRTALFVAILTGIAYGAGATFRFFELTGMYIGAWIGLVAALAASYVMTRFVNRKPFGAIGLAIMPTTLRDFGLGTLLGFLAMGMIALVLLAIGGLQISPRDLDAGTAAWIVLSSVFLFSIGALTEEVLFRGYVFQTLVQGITMLPALIIMALLFAAAHLANPNASMFGIVNVALAALTFSFAYLKTRSLWLPLGLHFGWNFSQTTVFGFPTSGIDFDNHKLFLLTQSGPDWLTGGAFGPEGGALATAALAGWAWYILKSKRLSAPAGIITLDSVEDLLPESEEKAIQ